VGSFSKTTSIEQPLISLIILNHNGLTQNKEMLTQCIKDALSVRLNKEVILVDNGSTDNSLEYVVKTFPRCIRYITLDENLGYSRGMNEGAKHASPNSRYLFFVNNDVSFSEDVVSGMIDILEKNPDAAIVGAGIWHRDRVFVGSTLDIRLTHHTPRAKEIPYNVSAVENFIAVRTEVFKKLGGFEPNIFQVYDEADLCLRAWLAGYRVMCDPRLVVYHRHRLPIKRGNPERVLRFMRNKYFIMIKYYDLHYLALYIPIKFFTDIWWSIADPSWRRRRSIIMVFKSISDLIQNLPTYWERRMAASIIRTRSIKHLIQMGIIAK